MKKRLLILSIFVSTLLAGCGSNTDVEKKNLNPKIIEANAKELSDLTDKVYIDYKSTFSAEGLEYLEQGLARYSIGGGYYSYENVLLKKQVASQIYGSNYRIYDANYINFCVALPNSNSKYNLYDSYGNRLLELTSLTNVYGVYTTIVNDTVYLQLETYNGTFYFEYNGQRATQVNNIPQSSQVSEEQPTVEVGSLYVGVQNIDLEDFGNGGYYLSTNGSLVTTFKLNHEAVATFSFPQTNAAGIVGNKFLFQETYVTSDYAEEYDYTDGGKKYVVNTYSIDYLTGKKSNVSMNYKLESISSFKDEDKLYKLGIVSAKPILNNKVLGKSESYLMDSKLEFIQNVSNEYLTSFVKLNSGYFYNTTSKILYNENLKPVTYLYGLTVNFYKNLPDYIFISQGSKIGAITTKGIVVAKCTYDSFLSGDNNKLLFREGSNYYYITQDGESTKEMSSDKYQWITANLFKKVDTAVTISLEIDNEEKSLLKVYSENTEINYTGTVSVSGTNYQAYVVCYTDATETTCTILATSSSY